MVTLPNNRHFFVESSLRSLKEVEFFIRILGGIVKVSILRVFWSDA